MTMLMMMRLRNGMKCIYGLCYKHRKRISAKARWNVHCTNIFDIYLLNAILFCIKTTTTTKIKQQLKSTKEQTLKAFTTKNEIKTFLKCLNVVRMYDMLF